MERKAKDLQRGRKRKVIHKAKPYVMSAMMQEHFEILSKANLLSKCYCYVCRTPKYVRDRQD